MKYFKRVGTNWQIIPELRQLIDFCPLNLIEQWPLVSPLDLVFLRNVLIYFDPPTKGRVLEAISNVLAPDGVLLLGGAETVLGITEKFKPLNNEHGLYVQTGYEAAAAKAAVG